VIVRSLASITLILWTAQVSTPGSAVISGRLLTTEGAPAAGVRVIALDTAYPRLNIVSQTETDRDGRYRLENVSAGEYFIVADPFKIPSYYPGTGNRDDSVPIAVTAGAVRYGVDFRSERISGILRVVRTPLPGETRFSGVLRDTQGKGLPNFTVALSSSRTDTKLWTVTDASGSFAFASLTAGEFLMEAFALVPEPYEDVRLPITLRANESLEEHVGVRQLGNFQQRPDLYGSGDPRSRAQSLGQRGPGAPTFWRCQNLSAQVQPEYSEALRAANAKGSVDVLVNVDPNGRLDGLRIASAGSNPDLAKAAVKAVSQWKFTPIKWRYVSLTQNIVGCNGEGDVQEFQGVVTFDFPPAR
jgi:TonB family protein